MSNTQSTGSTQAKTKLGLFINASDHTFEHLLGTQNMAVVKTIELDPGLISYIKKRSPKTTLVARSMGVEKKLPINWNDHQLDPIAKAHEFVNLLLPIAQEKRRFQNIDAWESYNEPIINTVTGMKNYALFEAERTRLLAEKGIRSCVGNFSTGNPPLELWPAFFPALEAVNAHNGFLGLHEYSAPYMWSQSGTHSKVKTPHDQLLTLRYRYVYDTYLKPNGLGDIPLMMTEMGIDGGVIDRPRQGWLDFKQFWYDKGKITNLKCAGKFYMEQLKWYNSELMQDSYVKGAAIFTYHQGGGFESFEVNGDFAKKQLLPYFEHPRDNK